MEFSAVLFDMNGVIVDDEHLHFLAFQKLMNAHGKSLDAEGYKNYFAGKTDRDGLASYSHTFPLSEDITVLIDVKTRYFQELSSENLQPFDGVTDLVRALSAKYKLALVTSSCRDEAKTVLNAFSISDAFAVVITSEDVMKGKPNPEGYLMGAKGLGVQPKECVVVEDSPSGVKAAKEAGMRCIAVMNTHSKEELNRADRIVDRLELKVFN